MVWWEACVVPYARCVEVTGSHVGLALNRKAYREIAAALAATTDRADAPGRAAATGGAAAEPGARAAR